MRKLAIYLTDFVIHNGKTNNQDREIYEYGFQIFLETILSFSICFLIAYKIEMLKEGFLFFLIFIPLRSYAGGFHFDKYILCLFCSCATFFSVLYIAKIIRFSDMLFILIPFLLMSIRLLYPVQHINRPIDEEEKKYFKKKLNIFLCIDLIASIALFITKKEGLLEIILLTLLLILITMVIGKISYYLKLKEV